MTNKEKQDFFNQLLVEAKHNDPELIEKIYYAFLRTVGKGLKYNKSIEVPYLGKFELIYHKAYKGGDVNNPGRHLIVPAQNIIKFRPNKHLKTFCK